jgi:hypothetical protein
MNKIYLRSFLIALTASLMPASAFLANEMWSPFQDPSHGWASPLNSGFSKSSVCGDAFAVDRYNSTAIAYPIQKTLGWGTKKPGCYGDTNDPIFKSLKKQNPKLDRYDMPSIQAENLQLRVIACAEKPDQAPTLLTTDNADKVDCNTEPYPYYLTIPQPTRTESTIDLGTQGSQSSAIWNGPSAAFDKKNDMKERNQEMVKTLEYVKQDLVEGQISQEDLQKLEQTILRAKGDSMAWVSLQAELPILNDISEKDKMDIQTLAEMATKSWNQVIKDAGDLMSEHGEKVGKQLMKVQKSLDTYHEYVQEVSNIVLSKNENMPSN